MPCHAMLINSNHRIDRGSASWIYVRIAEISLTHLYSKFSTQCTHVYIHTYV